MTHPDTNPWLMRGSMHVAGGSADAFCNLTSGTTWARLTACLHATNIPCHVFTSMVLAQEFVPAVNLWTFSTRPFIMQTQTRRCGLVQMDAPSRGRCCYALITVSSHRWVVSILVAWVLSCNVQSENQASSANAVIGFDRATRLSSVPRSVSLSESNWSSNTARRIQPASMS